MRSLRRCFSAMGCCSSKAVEVSEPIQRDSKAVEVSKAVDGTLLRDPTTKQGGLESLVKRVQTSTEEEIEECLSGISPAVLQKLEKVITEVEAPVDVEPPKFVDARPTDQAPSSMQPVPKMPCLGRSSTWQVGDSIQVKTDIKEAAKAHATAQHDKPSFVEDEAVARTSPGAAVNTDKVGKIKSCDAVDGGYLYEVEFTEDAINDDGDIVERKTVEKIREEDLIKVVMVTKTVIKERVVKGQ